MIKKHETPNNINFYLNITRSAKIVFGDIIESAWQWVASQYPGDIKEDVKSQIDLELPYINLKSKTLDFDTRHVVLILKNKRIVKVSSGMAFNLTDFILKEYK